MFEPLIETFVGAAIDRLVDHGVVAYAGAAERSAAGADAAGRSTLVRDLIRGTLDGRPRTQLLAQAEAAGRPPGEAAALVDRLLADCRRQVEEPLLRWGTWAAALLWFGPALMLVWMVLGRLFHGPEGLERAAGSLDSTFFFAVVGIAIAVGFFGAKALFPKWYAIHKALRRNDAAVSDRMVTEQLARQLGPLGGHLWFLGHEGYSARSTPLRLLAAALLAPFGVTAWFSWRTALALRSMDDEQFSAWTHGVAPKVNRRADTAGRR